MLSWLYSFSLSDVVLTINNVVTFILAIVTFFYYRRYLPSVSLSHLRSLWLDYRYLDIRLTISNNSQSAAKLKAVYLLLPDKRRLEPLPESVLRTINVSEKTLNVDLDELIQLYQDPDQPLQARAGELVETPLFIKPCGVLKARFVFDGQKLKGRDMRGIKLVLCFPYHKKKLKV